MDKFLAWWKTGLSPWVKFVYVVLLLNGLPAFLILLSMPDLTEQWFVWTVAPPASARLLGVMYGNALLLVGLGVLQPTWARARVTLVVITLFSVAATLVTLLNLGPFLKHPWFHLAYWLTMYCILFVAAPVVFVAQERGHGGRLPVEVPLPPLARALAAFGLAACGLTGLGLLANVSLVNPLWPWTLTPLVGGIVGVWFTTLAAGYAWTLWDGDWRRTRIMFQQAIPTGLGLALLPLLHAGDVRPGAGGLVALYLALALLPAAGALVLLLTMRRAPLAEAGHAGP
jgi:hypothetical protein